MNEESIFAQAVKLDGIQRGEFVRSACGDNLKLLNNINSLLDAHAQPDSMLEVGAKQLVSPEDLLEVVELAGCSIGPYKLLQIIGEGGMGVVYLAEQSTPVERRIAIKIVKPGLDTREVIARFEAERQALSMMDHPHIARVLDVGAYHGGRPYFVMELIGGIKITDYCKEHKLTVEQRLKLMIFVCQAVQHAHQKGVIHRDLKPSNVLVTTVDGLPTPKIIDFGVAKAIDRKLTAISLHTRMGQLVGTLEYMSPEQARFNHLLLDTRTDIYSLGVLLYELLTDSLPLPRERLEALPFDEALQVIRLEEPPKPSSRVRSMQAMDAALGKAHAELDWIVMKAMAKDPSRRYDTASALADDLQRFLNHRSVSACPPSTGYLVRKFVQRNRSLIISGGILVLISVAVVAVTLGLINHQRKIAILARQRAESNLDVAVDLVAEIIGPTTEHLFHQLDPAFANEEIIAKAIPGLKQLAQYSEDSRISRELANCYQAFARNKAKLGFDSTENAQLAIESATQLVAESPADPKLSLLLASAYKALAHAEANRGRWEAVTSATGRIVELTEQSRAGGPQLAWAHQFHSHGLRKSRRYESADAHARIVINLVRRGEVDEGPSAISLLSRAERTKIFMAMANWQQAQLLMEEALEIANAMPVANAINKQAFYRFLQGKLHLTCAAVCNGQRHPDLALQHATTSRAIFAEEYVASRRPVDSARGVAKCLLEASDAAAMGQDFTEAERYLHEAIRRWEDLGHDVDLSSAAVAKFRLAQILFKTNREKAAHHQLAQAIDQLSFYIEQFPQETTYRGLLLMFLVLAPGNEGRHFEQAAHVANHESFPPSLFIGCRALALSNVGDHQTATKWIKVLERLPQGRDAIQLLIASIVHGQAGDIRQARTNYEQAIEAIDDGSPVYFCDYGPLAIDTLQQQASLVIRERQIDVQSE